MVTSQEASGAVIDKMWDEYHEDASVDVVGHILVVLYVRQSMAVLLSG
jgi:hypothetical protein